MIQRLARASIGRRLTILTHHRVPRDLHHWIGEDIDLAGFERHLRQLSSRYSIVPLREALRRMRAGTLEAGALVLTFDDAYVDWIDGVAPLLRRLDIPATFFVTTGPLHGERLWNEWLELIVRDAPERWAFDVPVIGRQTHVLGSRVDRALLLSQMSQALKYAPVESRRAALEALQATIHAQACTRWPRLFTADDVRTLHGWGFEIGSHTVRHPILSIANPEAARAELVESKLQLEAILGEPVDGLAYPNGIVGDDFGAEHSRMAREAGFRYAVTTSPGVATSETDLLSLPRFTPWRFDAVGTWQQLARNARHVVRTSQETAAAARQAVMVAFHYPPQAGSSGVLRTLNFSRYLPSLGWRVRVVSARPTAYERIAEDSVDEIPSDCGVVRAPGFDSARGFGWRGRYFDVSAVPDRWWTWMVGGLMATRRSFAATPANVVWSTYPIASAHVLGGLLARWHALPWVADFRDPMLSDDHPSGALRRWVWRHIESFTLRHAERCVFTNRNAARLYAARYPAAAHKCVVIENGYDEGAFNGVSAARDGVPKERILMLHSGLIYPRNRDPGAFFAALRALHDAGELDLDRLWIRFRACGHVDEVRASAQQHGVAHVVDVAPPVPYRQAIAEMLGADLLLLFQGAQFNAQVPAKVYEYLRAGRPILGLVDHEGETAALLRDMPASWCADIQQRDEIADRLRQWQSAAGTQAFDHGLAQQQSMARRYAREAQAGLLAALLAEVTAGRNAPG